MDLTTFTLDELHELRASSEGAEAKQIIREIVKRRSAGERFIAEKQVLEAQKKDRSSGLTCLGIAVFLVAAVIVIGWALSYSSGGSSGVGGGYEYRSSGSAPSASKAGCLDGIARVEILGSTTSLWATSNSGDGRKLADIPNGTIVRTWGVCSGLYSNVTALGQEGWMNSGVLKATD